MATFELRPDSGGGKRGGKHLRTKEPWQKPSRPGSAAVSADLTVLSDGKGLWQEADKGQVGNAAQPGCARLQESARICPSQKGSAVLRKKGICSTRYFRFLHKFGGTEAWTKKVGHLAPSLSSTPGPASWGRWPASPGAAPPQWGGELQQQEVSGMLTALHWPDLSGQDAGSGPTREGSAGQASSGGGLSLSQPPPHPLCQKQRDRPGGKAGTWPVGYPGVTTGLPQGDSKVQPKYLVQKLSVGQGLGEELGTHRFQRGPG